LPFFSLAIIALLAAMPARASDNGLAKTPPMGWNSWNAFHCHVSDDMIRGMADAMVSSGMKDAGYEYIVIDDCWQVARDAAGNIVVDKDQFPNGMKALADYVHSKGLKFGIYSDAGTQTCAGRPGSAGHEFQDAIQYAAWGVDYLKFDWCHTGKPPAQANSEWAYSTMRDALKASGRPILFSICEWGSTKPWLWAGPIGNMWRTTGDISDCWDCDKHGLSFVTIVDAEDGLETYAGPGHWNDPDMLEVGNGKMTTTEYRAHFSLWSLLAAPLIAGNDLRNMSADTKEILTNKEVLPSIRTPPASRAIASKKTATSKSGRSNYKTVAAPSCSSIAAPPNQKSPSPGRTSATPRTSPPAHAICGRTKTSAKSPANTKPPCHRTAS